MNSKRSSYRGFGIYLLLILAIIGIWYWMDGNTSTNSYTRAQFETAVADGNVAQLKIVPNRGEVPTGNVYITFKDSSTQVLAVNDVNDIEDYLRDQQFTSYTVENPPEQSWIVTILPYLIIFAAMFIFFMIMTNQAAANSGGGGKMMNFGKSRAKLMTDDPAKRVTFANVAGLKEEKEELEEIVDFLRAPKKYTRLGARIPRVFFSWDLREPVRHFWQRRLPVRQACRSLVFPVRILWRCLLASALRVSVICLRKPRKMRRVSCLSMRSMLSQDGVVPVWAAATMSASRH